MNNMMWLVRAAHWVRNPPSAGRVWLSVAVVGAVIALGTIEWMGWWPDWAHVNGRGMRMMRP
ncbi:hypothetical protein [Paracoccus contaminans]|uniref:Uncharacterized protein n=1 Tax=Paracoccus contaminans TaxID=1945662 RepID=A0A1W6D198_9RHOB|nr:hypothetical protein [Paracoccus contaminans]ARJ70887.1 hypothetical protein B0A89_11410 [Paracoccus contaminans]